MPTFAPLQLTDFAASILEKAGLPEDQAHRVADHLVESNLMGHDSHGVIRIPGYTKSLLAGNYLPVGDHEIERESSTIAVIDAKQSMGIVLAYEAMELAVEKACLHDVGAVTVHSATHIGRLGAFPPLAAARDCIGIIMLNGGGRFTAPFGGTERRLPPNPLAICVPAGPESTMMLDITTSMVAGGKVEIQAAREKEVPEGWLIDLDGKPVLDPNVFRSSDVAMLPLGGLLGHKGYGLSMMIDVIAGALSRAGCSREQPTRGASGFLCLSLRIEAFVDLAEYYDEVRHLIGWVKSARTAPGVSAILIPGELEEIRMKQRMAEGIPIEDKTWEELKATGSGLGVQISES